VAQKALKMNQDWINETTVLAWLELCGIRGVSLDDHPELGPDARAVKVKRYGVDVWLILTPTGPPYLSLRVVLGLVPQVAVAALFRKVLSINMTLWGPRFALCEPGGTVCLAEWPHLKARKVRNEFVPVPHEEFTLIFDRIVAVYHEHAPQLINEFQLQQA
jgi:hypothetical protein